MKKSKETAPAEKPGTLLIRCEGAELIPIKDLVPFQGKFKGMVAVDKKKLRRQMIREGIAAAATVWRHKVGAKTVLSLLDGHQRHEVLTELAAEGWKVPPIPVNFTDCKNEAEARRTVMSLASTYGRVNQDELVTFAGLAELNLAELNQEFDFPDIDLGSIQRNSDAAGLSAGADAAAPPKPAKPITKPGDLWKLGPHRLICGDSTDGKTVLRLMQEAKRKPQLMVTDPPYGVDYDPHWRHEEGLNNSKRVGKVLNDTVADWTEAWRLFAGDVAYVWHAGRFGGVVQASLEKCDFQIRSQIVWAKQRFVISRGDYHWQHEPCFYAVRKGATGHWTGSRKDSTLWAISNLNGGEADKEKATIHGTQKPLECMGRPIRNNSREGDYVYDPFLGSGTTLHACEVLKRVCLGVELDPGYCDVVVARWELLTKRKATRESK